MVIPCLGYRLSTEEVITTSALLGSSLVATGCCLTVVRRRAHLRAQRIGGACLPAVCPSSVVLVYSQMARSRAIAELVCSAHPFTCTAVVVFEQKIIVKSFHRRPSSASLLSRHFPTVPNVDPMSSGLRLFFPCRTLCSGRVTAQCPGTLCRCRPSAAENPLGARIPIFLLILHAIWAAMH